MIELHLAITPKEMGPPVYVSHDMIGQITQLYNCCEVGLKGDRNPLLVSESDQQVLQLIERERNKDSFVLPSYEIKILKEEELQYSVQEELSALSKLGWELKTVHIAFYEQYAKYRIFYFQRRIE